MKFSDENDEYFELMDAINDCCKIKTISSNEIQVLIEYNLSDDDTLTYLGKNNHLYVIERNRIGMSH